MIDHGYWDMTEASLALKASERTIRRRIQNGELIGKKDKGKWFIEKPSDGSNSKSAEVRAESMPTSAELPKKTAPQSTKHLVSQDGDNSKLASLLKINENLASWDILISLNQALEKTDLQATCRQALAYLIEGYLGYGARKTQAYCECRHILAGIIIELQMVQRDDELVASCYKALQAVNSLIISVSKNDRKEEGFYRKKSKSKRYYND